MKNLQILFKLWNQCSYGKAIYILGNTVELGNWKIENAIRMDWNSDDVWQKQIEISYTKEEQIEYKYLIAEYQAPANFIWEKGPNRTVKLKNKFAQSMITPNLSIIRDDKWQQRKIVIKLVDDALSQQILKLQQLSQNIKQLQNNNSKNQQQIQNKIQKISEEGKKEEKNLKHINNKLEKIQKQQNLTNLEDSLEEDIQFYIRGNITPYKSNELNLPILMQQKTKNPSQEEILSCTELMSPENSQFSTNAAKNNNLHTPSPIRTNKDKFDLQNLITSQQYQHQQQLEESYPDIWWEGYCWIDIVEQKKVKYCFQKKIKNEFISDRQVRKVVITSYFDNKDKLILKNSQTVFNFSFSKVDENIFLGPYPQGKDNIQQMQKSGINAVLNLQTEEDMDFRGIKWKDQQDLYEQYNITAVNFPIIDMDCQDMSIKLIQVSKVLDLLIQQYQTVYVHCTAGIFRSPQTVIGYYCFFKKLNVSQAISLVEQKHPICKKNRIYLKTVLQNLLEQHHNGEEQKFLFSSENQSKEVQSIQTSEINNTNGNSEAPISKGQPAQELKQEPQQQQSQQQQKQYNNIAKFNHPYLTQFTNKKKSSNNNIDIKGKNQYFPLHSSNFDEFSSNNQEAQLI